MTGCWYKDQHKNQRHWSISTYLDWIKALKSLNQIGKQARSHDFNQLASLMAGGSKPWGIQMKDFFHNRKAQCNPSPCLKKGSSFASPLHHFIPHMSVFEEQSLHLKSCCNRYYITHVAIKAKTLQETERKGVKTSDFHGNLLYHVF